MAMWLKRLFTLFSLQGGGNHHSLTLCNEWWYCVYRGSVF